MDAGHPYTLSSPTHSTNYQPFDSTETIPFIHHSHSKPRRRLRTASSTPSSSTSKPTPSTLRRFTKFFRTNNEYSIKTHNQFHHSKSKSSLFGKSDSLRNISSSSIGALSGTSSTLVNSSLSVSPAPSNNESNTNMNTKSNSKKPMKKILSTFKTKKFLSNLFSRTKRTNKTSPTPSTTSTPITSSTSSSISIATISNNQFNNQYTNTLFNQSQQQEQEQPQLEPQPQSQSPSQSPSQSLLDSSNLTAAEFAHVIKDLDEQQTTTTNTLLNLLPHTAAAVFTCSSSYMEPLIPLPAPLLVPDIAQCTLSCECLDCMTRKRSRPTILDAKVFCPPSPPTGSQEVAAVSSQVPASVNTVANARLSNLIDLGSDGDDDNNNEEEEENESIIPPISSPPQPPILVTETVTTKGRFIITRTTTTTTTNSSPATSHDSSTTATLGVMSSLSRTVSYEQIPVLKPSPSSLSIAASLNMNMNMMNSNSTIIDDEDGLWQKPLPQEPIQEEPRNSEESQSISLLDVASANPADPDVNRELVHVQRHVRSRSGRKFTVMMGGG